MIHAPFTDAQVHALKRWQNNPLVHPFTCCDHVTMTVDTDGFFCPKCMRYQTWCHEFIVGEPPQRIRSKATGQEGELLTNEGKGNCWILWDDGSVGLCHEKWLEKIKKG